VYFTYVMLIESESQPMDMEKLYQAATIIIKKE